MRSSRRRAKLERRTVAIGCPLLDPAKRISFVQENVFVEQTMVGDTVFVFQGVRTVVLRMGNFGQRRQAG